MSAFVVSKKHLATIVNFAVKKGTWLGGKTATVADYDYIWKTLANENVRSVCHRYGDDKPENYASFVRPSLKGKTQCDDPVAVLKLCNCLDYQSCETEDWKSTQAYKILDEIRCAAVNALPGYKEAKWAID